MLREQVSALKEKDAEWSGKDRALCNQLRCRDQELKKSRSLLHDMQCYLKEKERQHKETLEDIRLQMRAVASECKQMQLKLKYVCGTVDPIALFEPSLNSIKSLSVDSRRT